LNINIRILKSKILNHKIIFINIQIAIYVQKMLKTSVLQLFIDLKE